MVGYIVELSKRESIQILHYHVRIIRFLAILIIFSPLVCTLFLCRNNCDLLLFFLLLNAFFLLFSYGLNYVATNDTITSIVDIFTLN